MNRISLLSDYKILEYGAIDSTNIQAKRIIQSGAAPGRKFVITAESQTAGKGRLGRSWVSNQGNLFVSIVVLQTELAVNAINIGHSEAKYLFQGAALSTNATKLNHCPFLAAIAIGATLQNFLDEKPLYKWPNDVLVGGRKISGALIETISDYIVFGIGVNIASYPETGTRMPATCLSQNTGSNIKTAEVLGLLINKFDEFLRLDAQEIMRQWHEAAYGLGGEISVHQGENEISGIFKGVDENGWLILDTKRGKRELVSFGDINWI